MERDIKVLKVIDAGNDVLVVQGTVDGKKAEARGWVSATTNHFDFDAYDTKTGHRKKKASPRGMDGGERHAYYAALLNAAVPASAPEPIVLYEAAKGD